MVRLDTTSRLVPRFSVTAVAAALAISLGACGGKIDQGPGDDMICDPVCEGDLVCRFQSCVPAPEPCAQNGECAGDAYCDTAAGECLPWGVGPGGDSDPACTRDVVAGVFFPDVQCEWLGPPAGDPYPAHTNVLGAPMVADLRFAGDPEIGRPAIVFISYNFTDGGAQSCQGTDPLYTGVIRVIDGRTCEQRLTIDAPLPIASTSVALGDLNRDGRPEIVAATVGGGLAAWEVGVDRSVNLLWQTNTTYGASTCNWTGPSIHDLDDDGSPEVLMYGGVFDAEGVELTSALGLLNTNLATGYIPVAADIDRDGQVELVTGAAIYGWNAAGAVWELEAPLGPTNAHAAVADLGSFGIDPSADNRARLDGVAEVVTVNQGIIRVFALSGRELFSAPIPGGGAGGPPTIADFDGDGRAEFAAAGGSAYSVFDLDCQGAPNPATCPERTADGVLWSQPSQDLSSNKTGSSVFDFEGDGLAEAVYGDECFTRVYDGSSGDVLYSRFRTSCTWYENPIVADVDADFGAEVVITSNTNCATTCPAIDPIFDGVRCFDESDCPGSTTCRRELADDPVGRCRCELDEDCGGDGFACLDPIAGPSPEGRVCRAAHPGPSTALGVRVITDKLGRWVNTRTIWNQHAYAVTNVKDNGEIPRTAEWARNWEQDALNNFRQNAPGAGAGAGLMPDLTLRRAAFSCGAGGAEIRVEVCNRGTEAVADGIAVTASAGGAALCAAVTQTALFPGQCELVTCTADVQGEVEVIIAADTASGASAGGDLTECREDNNQIALPGVRCP